LTHPTIVSQTQVVANPSSSMKAVFLTLLLFPGILLAQTTAPMLHPTLHTYLNARAQEFQQIDSERKEALIEIARYIRNQNQEGHAAQLIFICTHNSRRSHLSQLWAAAAMHFYALPPIESYSGGTEITAFNIRAVKALRAAGFLIPDTTGDNPVYQISLGPNLPVIGCFSKHYADAPNPKTGFAAVMTCSSADEACPIVFGASERFAIPYDDPKLADGSPEEAARYAERCQQIAREMLFMASQIAE
jgi:arsenate reductase